VSECNLEDNQRNRERDNFGCKERSCSFVIFRKKYSVSLNLTKCRRSSYLE
jgi:hypothetical protein